MKSGSLNLLEPSGPVYACTGIALHLSPLLHSQIRVQGCYLPHHRMDWGKINPLNAELNPICHLLALLGAHHILHVSRVRVKLVPWVDSWAG